MTGPAGSPISRWEQIARSGAGDEYAARYAARFRSLAATGADTHGEAGFVGRLRPAPARVLDAGCGTGRVAVRLAAMGYDVTGIDADRSMLAQARAEAPGLTWQVEDLARFDLGERFDVVLMAGNVVPLLEPGALSAATAALARHVDDGGLLVAGFGLDAAHLPGDCPVTPLTDWEGALAAAGLHPVDRLAGWDADDPAYRSGFGYVVTVDGRAAPLNDG